MYRKDSFKIEKAERDCFNFIFPQTTITKKIASFRTAYLNRTVRFYSTNLSIAFRISLSEISIR